MDQVRIIKFLKDQGQITLQLPGDKMLQLLPRESWKKDQGNDWIFLLYDLFQIRSICQSFSEVSLDIVDFASKPTIYHSPVNKLLEEAPVVDGLVKFSLIREPNWNKLLFQIGKPILARLQDGTSGDMVIEVPFPLQIKDVKELFLGAEGEVKIYKK